MMQSVSQNSDGYRSTAKEAELGWRKASQWPHRLTPPRLLLLIAVLVFTAEAAIMLLLSYFPPMPRYQQALFDAGVLLLLLSPAYFFLFIPLRRAYAAHLKADSEIRRLSREMILSLERERARFAKDLHDNHGQLLTALQLGLDILRLTLPADREDLSEQCRHLQGLVGQIGDHIRSLSADFRPPLLETCGVKAALEWYLEKLQKENPETQFCMHLSGCEGRLGSDLEITLFRLCQEGLANAVRHGQARRTEIRVSCGSSGIDMLLRDDGVGFDHLADEAQGLGLICMRERIFAHGGSFLIESERGQGTSLRIRFPAAEMEKSP